MEKQNGNLIGQAKEAAIEVLRHNAHGPYRGFPRTAGWGYPEPWLVGLLLLVE